jgi:hypothetical protein
MNSDLEYLKQQGLDHYMDFSAVEPAFEDPFAAVRSGELPAIPPEAADLARLHRLIRRRKSFTVLEFGAGYSTIVIADALKKNQSDWEALPSRPALRNRHLFHAFTVDASKGWLAKADASFPASLRAHVTFHHSSVHIGTHNGQLAHFYDSLPDIIPDFIYLDGPDPKDVQGSIHGLTFQCDERTVMAADLLLMESTFLPGTFILVDGRTNNARFLARNFQRSYDVHWDRAADITTLELIEDRLGALNILGTDLLPA